MKYFDWMCSLVSGDHYSKGISYRKLLFRLHKTPFIYILERDGNRAADGISLRNRFGYENGYGNDLIEQHLGEHDCSVLEMMISLSLRCEEDIMDDPDIGNRLGQWFWNMIVNLGLGAMTDSRFDTMRVDSIVSDFLYRRYEPNGTGGLFTIPYCKSDLREVEIWYQMCWYLDSIL